MKLPTHVLMMTLASTIVLGGATTASAQEGTCSEPWITKAIQEVEGRPAIGTGILGECMPSLYIDTTKTKRGASPFSSYADAHRKVAATSKKLRGQRLSYQLSSSFASVSNANRYNLMQNNRLVGNDGSSMVAAGSLNFRRGDKSVQGVFDLPGGRKLVVTDASTGTTGREEKK